MCRLALNASTSWCTLPIWSALLIIFAHLTHFPALTSQVVNYSRELNGKNRTQFLVYSTGLDLKWFPEPGLTSHIVPKSLLENVTTSFAWIRAFDYYLDARAQLRLIWTDAHEKRSFLHSAILNVERMHLEQIEQIVNFDSVVSNLAIDRRNRLLYVSLKHLNRVEQIDLLTNVRTVFVNNTEAPGDIAVDSRSGNVFFIANLTCIHKVASSEKLKKNFVCAVDSETIISIDYDEEKELLYWILEDGAVYRKKLTGRLREEQLILPRQMSAAGHTRRKLWPSSLHVVNNATHLLIYVCDSKSYLILRTSLKYNGTKFAVNSTETSALIVDSVNAYDVEIIDLQRLNSMEQLTTSISSSKFAVENNTQQELAHDSSKVEHEGQGQEGSQLWIAVTLISLCSLVVLILALIAYKRRASPLKPARKVRTVVGRNPRQSRERSTDKVVSIEDLGGFTNASYDYSQYSNQTCDFCDYKEECLNKGICLSTYRLLDSVSGQREP